MIIFAIEEMFKKKVIIMMKKAKKFKPMAVGKKALPNFFSIRFEIMLNSAVTS